MHPAILDLNYNKQDESTLITNYTKVMLVSIASAVLQHHIIIIIIILELLIH